MSEACTDFVAQSSYFYRALRLQIIMNKCIFDMHINLILFSLNLSVYKARQSKEIYIGTYRPEVCSITMSLTAWLRLRENANEYIICLQIECRIQMLKSITVLG